MSTIFDSRKYIVLFTVAALGLILWLTISFWVHAYLNRQDAINIQRSNVLEDKLFALTSSLSKERALTYKLSTASIIDPDSIDSFRATVTATDTLFEASFNDDSESLQALLQTRLSHERLAAFNAAVSTIEDDFKQLSEQRRISDNGRMPLWSTDRADNGMTRFKLYSSLIKSIGDLRKDVHFVPRNSNQDIISQSDLKEAVWDLSEITAQIASLLENVLLLTRVPNASLNATEHATMLIELNTLSANSLDDISLLSRRYEISSALQQHKLRTTEWYNNDYRTLTDRLIGALANNTIQLEDLATWLSAATELNLLVEALYRNTSETMEEAVSDIKETATRNLIIDTVLVLICLSMAIAAIYYFRRIHRQAHQDELTGLSNRRQFALDLDQSLDAAKSGQKQVALIIIDLDRFKQINDSMGHAAGDRLLRRVADRIKQRCDNTDAVARVGGDEFAILKRASSPTEIAAFAESLREALTEPFAIDNGIVQIGGSLGISHYPTDASNAGELMNSADLAMYYAKKLGRNRIAEYTPELATDYDFRVKTEADLQTALYDNQFELYFQPKFNLPLARVDSVETLIRWHHPERGMVPPDKFIPIAEECGLLPAIGHWVLNESCRQAAHWLSHDNLSLRVAVNVSAEQFLQADFVEQVQQCLDQHHLPAQNLELEVTESAVMADIDSVVDALTAFRQLGIKIALDDFGTGYSSLSYLQDLPLDTLKIDKSFIQKLETGDDQYESITEAITDLAKTLGLDTVAEGVETDDQLNRVASLGIASVQGYYYSRPVPAGDINDIVTTINNDNRHKRKSAI